MGFTLQTRKCKARIGLIVTALILAATPCVSAASTRPVSIGVNANWEQNLALQANLGWTRLDIAWSDINPQPNVWDFAVTDSRVNDALAQGQQILAILHVVPSWLTTNADIPPLSTSQWSTFVQQMAQHFAGRIAAYEIWNEPDDSNINGDGIGWGRNIEEPPLYTDFVHAAAVQIRAYAPGTLVVAPAFQSRNTASGVDNRKKRILEQIQAASYSAHGPGYNFVDAVSVHNNAGDTEPSRDMGRRLNYENLAYVWNHAPSMRTKPIWVTEYGLEIQLVTEAGQSEKICNVTRTYTGLLEAAYTNLGDWDVRRAFIYALKDGGSRQIFRSDNTPKPTVTQYLQHLAYPAVQNPAYSADYPACSGIGLAAFAASSPATSGDVWSSLVRFGLRDPRSRIPAGFPELLHRALSRWSEYFGGVSEPRWRPCHLRLAVLGGQCRPPSPLRRRRRMDERARPCLGFRNALGISDRQGDHPFAWGRP